MPSNHQAMPIAGEFLLAQLLGLIEASHGHLHHRYLMYGHTVLNREREAEGELPWVHDNSIMVAVTYFVQVGVNVILLS